MPALDARILRLPVDSPAWAGTTATPSSADRPEDIDAHPVEWPATAPGVIDASPITPIASGAVAARPSYATPSPVDVDPLTELLNRPIGSDESTILRARCDDVARRIVRDGGQVSIASLAREVGTAPATMKRLMSTRTFREVYDAVSDELMGSIDDRIVNERLDSIERQRSLQSRAMTVLAEALALSQAHARNVVDNNAILRPGIIKTGIEAATEIRQIGTALAGGATGGGSQVNINITRNHATVIQGAMRESGIDLSDVLGALYDAPPPLDHNRDDRKE